jgi:hypothetical protein
MPSKSFPEQETCLKQWNPSSLRTCLCPDKQEVIYVAFFHQFFDLTNNPALAPFANVPCRCQKYFMGGEGAHQLLPPSCFKLDRRTRACLAGERICNDAGIATNHKRVLTSEGHRRTDLEIRNIRAAQEIDLLVDVTYAMISSALAIRANSNNVVGVAELTLS